MGDQTRRASVVTGWWQGDPGHALFLVILSLVREVLKDRV